MAQGEVQCCISYQVLVYSHYGMHNPRNLYNYLHSWQLHIFWHVCCTAVLLTESCAGVLSLVAAKYSAQSNTYSYRTGSRMSIGNRLNTQDMILEYIFCWKDLLTFCFLYMWTLVATKLPKCGNFSRLMTYYFFGYILLKIAER